MRSLIQHAALLLSLSIVACGGAQSTSEGARPDEEAILNDTEVTQDELGARPSYTLRSRTPLGEYTSNESCAGGFDVCDRIVVKKVDGKIQVELGWDGWLKTEAWVSRGVLLFSTGDMQGDCDDPGCGNLVKITGVIYPVREGDRWVPQVKATVTADFPYPEEPESPEGEVRTVIRMKKQAQ